MCDGRTDRRVGLVQIVIEGLSLSLCHTHTHTHTHTHLCFWRSDRCARFLGKICFIQFTHSSNWGIRLIDLISSIFITNNIFHKC